uniref:Mitochondrial carrier 1 n=1 Tax=Pseudonaja textilis TaxID=8673 RepID=A0A670Z0V3_PSETE
MVGCGRGLGGGDGADALFVALSAGFTVLSHPLLYVKLLVQVGHEPLPPTVGRNLLGRKVLYLPGFFTYARHIVEVDGKMGLFRGLSPRIICSILSTINREQVKKAFPLEDMEHVSNKDDMKTSLRKVTKEFVGREYCYLIFSLFFSLRGLVPHVLGDLIFLWCCNLLAHFINTYAVDDNFNQASVIRSYTKFVMGIAVSMLTYPFLLVGDLMAVNNCGKLEYCEKVQYSRARLKVNHNHGKTANLTVVQKTIIDTFHKEGKPQKVIGKEIGCSQSAVSKHMNRKLCGREKCGRKRCTSSRDDCSLERIVSHSKVLGIFTRSGLRLESVHQEPPHTDGSWTWASNVVFLLSSRS